MCKSKRIPAIFLALALVVSLAVPSFAQTDRDAEIQPLRYDYIYQMECSLDTRSDGYAFIFAWADYIAGTPCAMSVTLKRNGERYDDWSTTSTNGFIKIEKELYDLPSGEYQAIMYITCGSDQDIVPSSVEEI